MVPKTGQLQIMDWRQNEAPYNASTSPATTRHCKIKVCSTLKTKGLSTPVWLLVASQFTLPPNQPSQLQLANYANRWSAQNIKLLPLIQPQHSVRTHSKTQLELSSMIRQSPRLLKCVLKGRSTTHKSEEGWSKFRSKSSAKKQLLKHNYILKQCGRKQPPNKLKNHLPRERCY